MFWMITWLKKDQRFEIDINSVDICFQNDTGLTAIFLSIFYTIDPPEVHMTNTLIKQELGKDTLVECKIAAFPQADISWERNGEKVVQVCIKITCFVKLCQPISRNLLTFENKVQMYFSPSCAKIQFAPRICRKHINWNWFPDAVNESSNIS